MNLKKEEFKTHKKSKSITTEKYSQTQFHSPLSSLNSPSKPHFHNAYRSPPGEAILVKEAMQSFFHFNTSLLQFLTQKISQKHAGELFDFEDKEKVDGVLSLLKKKEKAFFKNFLNTQIFSHLTNNFIDLRTDFTLSNFSNLSNLSDLSNLSSLSSLSSNLPTINPSNFSSLSSLLKEEKLKVQKLQFDFELIRQKLQVSTQRLLTLQSLLDSNNCQSSSHFSPFH